MLESVPKLQQGLQSFRNMRRMEASFKNARALQLRFSQSLARRRQRLSHAIVRSTIQRLGNCTNPFAWSDRLTISVLRRGSDLASALAKIGPWYALSANSFSRNGNRPNSVASNAVPPSRSWMAAEWTMACSNRPSVSTRICRFLPLISLPASNPCGSMRAPLFQRSSRFDYR